MSNTYKTKIIKASKVNHARVTKIKTPHGDVMTPAFMPVGSKAFVNHLTPHDLLNTKSQIILGGNTYYMLINAGMEPIAAAGGMHKLMGWHRPMVADGGSYQVFHLSKNSKSCIIDADGAHFNHPVTGKAIHVTPKTLIEAQKNIGADIVMPFAEYSDQSDDKEMASAAAERNIRWLRHMKEEHVKNPYSAYGHKQALFGIIQSGWHADLNESNAKRIIEMGVDGVAIGGAKIGLDSTTTYEFMDRIRPLLPENKIRYAMGVGLNPQDFIDAIAKGFDICDSDGPTKNARNGLLYHGHCVAENGGVKFSSDSKNSHLEISKSIYAHDDAPILAGCECYTCQHFSRAYLHLLFKQQSQLFSQLACIHNIYVMNDVCDFLRAVITNKNRRIALTAIVV